MKAHLKQIPAEGLHLEGEEACSIPQLEAEGIRCAGLLHYNIDIGVSSGALWVNGSLSQPVELRCVSCLEKFVLVVTAVVVNGRAHVLLQFRQIFQRRAGERLLEHRKSELIERAKHIQMAEQETKGKSNWSELDKLKLKRK